MSNECATLAQKRRVGSATKKAVLMYLADRASDDGSGIWTSKAHIAADTELSKRTVQNAMTDFERDGLILKVGTRRCRNGFTFEYRLVLTVLRTLPGTRDGTGAGDSPVQEIHPTHAGDSPHGVQEIHPNHPITIHEPPKTPIPPEGAGDLFSVDEIPVQQDPTPEVPDQFEELWVAFPKKPNMPGKDLCRKEYLKVLKRVSHGELMRAVRAYARTRDGEDPKYTSRLSKWLRDGNYEGFLAAQEHRWEDLSTAQQNALSDGRCPPSLMENGAPDEVAAYWLSKFRKAAG